MKRKTWYPSTYITFCFSFVYATIDPDQSIYGFRSAEPRNFQKMRDDFSEIGVINMEENYRSTGKILKAALHVITQGIKKIHKHSKAD